MAINIHPSIQKNHDCDYNDDDLGCTNEGKNRWINQLYMCVDGAFPGLLSRSPYNWFISYILKHLFTQLQSGC